MIRRSITLAGAAAVLLLAACTQTPVPKESWTGESVTVNAVHAVSLELTRRGTDLAGTYRADAVFGLFRGSLDGEELVASLVASPSCTYELSGVMTATQLDAAFVPVDCPGGLEGSWSLVRE